IGIFLRRGLPKQVAAPRLIRRRPECFIVWNCHKNYPLLLSVYNILRLGEKRKQKFHRPRARYTDRRGAALKARFGGLPFHSGSRFTMLRTSLSIGGTCLDSATNSERSPGAIEEALAMAGNFPRSVSPVVPLQVESKPSWVVFRCSG